VKTLSRDYPVETLCSVMSVSRAGYYKWLKREPSGRDIDREKLLSLVQKYHGLHRTHGYRWMAAFLNITENITVSDNYMYKCFRYLGIRSETEHRVKYRPRKVKDKYPNLIFSTWDTVDRPRQVIVSDMTVFKFGCWHYEVTFYFDVFTKEMLTFRVADRRGDRNPYIDGLKDVVELLKDCTEPTILHTDQGSVYASKAYNDLIKETVIVRSMSRAGKPTDNPVDESMNGWIKEELMTDFVIGKCHTKDMVVEVLTRYKEFYNEQRPSWALGYETPDHYRRMYYNGELKKRDTFSGRILSPEPKFVKKRREQAHSQQNTQECQPSEKENTEKC